MFDNCRLPLGKSVLEINNWFIQYRSILANKTQSPQGIVFHMLLNIDEEIKKKEREQKKKEDSNGVKSIPKDEEEKSIIDEVLTCLNESKIYSALDLSLHKEREKLLTELKSIFDDSGNADLKNHSKALDVLFNAFPPIMEDVVVYSQEGFYSNEISVEEVKECRDASESSILTSIQAERWFTVIKHTKIYDNIEMYVEVTPGTAEDEDIGFLTENDKIYSKTVHKNSQGILMVKYDENHWVQYTSLREDLTRKDKIIEKFGDKSKLKFDDLLQKRVLEIVPLVNTSGKSVACLHIR